MKIINIECLNRTPIDRKQEPVTVGIPLPQGTIVDTGTLVLHDSHKNIISLQTAPLNYWPDGSPKWVLCDFMGDVNASSQSHYFLGHDDKGPAAPAGCVTECGDDVWTVTTGKALFSVDAKVLRPFKSVQLVSGQEILGSGSEVILKGADGGKWQSEVEQIELETTGAVRTTVKLAGRFYDFSRRQLKFEARLHFYSGSARIKFELRLHNPAAAVHPGNLWDLGDPASVMLKEWSLQLHLRDSIEACLIQSDLTADWCDLLLTGGSLYQESSGGKNWDSPVHRDRSGAVPMSQPGWTLKTDTLIKSGDRAQPTLSIKTSDTQVAAAIANFWQRFPKELTFKDSTLKIGFLPECFPADHELQGGEQITEVVWLDFAADPSSPLPGSELQARCGAATYLDSGVFSEGLWSPTNENYKKLLNIALDSDRGFKAKREQVDEYGWRNFGELYADHESAFCQGDKPFVSHYNNQYDPLYSFYRLYLTGESVEWGDLAADLASHIADIDINHTDDDREEYCHGPFWHTDHYLDAGLSTHRMASREHLEHKNPAFCGGGPGAEHCYSSGLGLNYLLSGDERKKQLVLDLADWCWISLHGPQTVGAALLRGVKNFKRLRYAHGELWPRYPFTRGTGNCINASLDAFELTGDKIYLLRTAQLIQGTVQPDDDPTQRDLLNAESNWSYTVFLSALCRYLQTKQLWGQFDADFCHAKESLLTYARWMAEYEYSYLEKPESLEYPNETWAAQDLRKGVVLHSSAKYEAKTERGHLQKKAEFFLSYGLKELCQQKTGDYTRPLVLMMQNGWAVEAVKSQFDEIKQSIDSFHVGKPTPRVTFFECLARSLSDLQRVVPHTNLRREWLWLSSRLGKS